MVRKLLVVIGILGGALLFSTQIFAADPDAFIVDVQPSSFDPNMPVDMTITAVLADGTVVKDYEGDVYIDIPGSIDPSDYVVPSDHLYTFLPQDQWVKLFSKWLIINKIWTYTIQVSDIINDNIKWEKTVIVGAVSSEDLKTVLIDSPIQSWIEKNEIINIFWSAPDLPNSPFEIRVNNSSSAQWTTDGNGGINSYVTWLVEWINILQVKIFDINNTVLWESALISFEYDPIADGVFNSLQVLPAAKLIQGTKATFIVSTSDAVTSVELKMSNGTTAPMDRETAWSFKKELLLDTAGAIDVSLDLMIWGQKKSYTDVINLLVEKGTSIWRVRFFSDPVIATTLNVTWEVIGEASKYKVLYGTSSNSLIETVTTDTNEISLADLTTGTVYFFQISPLDVNGIEIWISSDIVQAKVGDLSAGATCVVKGIIISDITIGEKHYLIWSGVVNADKYIIYRSEFETTNVSQMSKIAEVTEPSFEYPFNANAKEEKYAYYVVEAICTDGSALVMDNVKKVQTWPAESILLFIVITLFLYTSYRLYNASTVTNNE